MECRICGNAEGNKPYQVAERKLGLGDKFEYVQCGVCRCLQITEVPPPLTMARYYPRGYDAYRPPLVGTGPAHALTRFVLHRRMNYLLTGRGTLGRLFWALLPGPRAVIFKDVGKGFHSHILDVGCGAGDLLCVLSAAGFAECRGVDPMVPSEMAYDNGVRIEKKDLADVERSFDIVIFHHSFEHVPDPLQTLGEAARVMRREGILILATPHVESWAWEKYRELWVQLDAPRHLHIHSQRSVAILAQKAGLKVIRTFCNSTDFQFAGSELYRRGKTFRSLEDLRSHFRPGELREYARKAKQFNRQGRGDSIVFHLKSAG